MNSEHLFKLALGLTSPWNVDKLEFSKTSTAMRQLDRYLSIPKGLKFKDFPFFI